MSYQIKNIPYLKKILWLDFAAGASTGLLGIFVCGFFSSIFGLPEAFLFWISVVTFVYSLAALSLNLSREISIPFLRGLIVANWAWVPVSMVFIFLHFGEASVLGKLFLLLQIVVVGGLAWIEGRQLEKQ